MKNALFLFCILGLAGCVKDYNAAYQDAYMAQRAVVLEGKDLELADDKRATIDAYNAANKELAPLVRPAAEDQPKKKAK